jgi:carboxyl-terminal processing protease
MSGMLSNLDPHSAYLDKDDLKDLQTVTTGKFGGIGIEITPYKGMIRVISPLDDTPAAKAGMKPGDLIVRIDKKLVKDMTLRQAVNMMRGPRGSIVNLTVIRQDSKVPLNFKIARDIVTVQTIKNKLLENGYGYVRIAFFQNNADDELISAIDKLKKESGGKLKGLVLDLRNNPGGLLDAAIDISDTFLDASKLKNKLIVYTKGKIPGADIEAFANSKDILNGTPMVVLINGGSASASEIVAGALQDHKRAVILGTKSFGKGSVQTVIPIDNESAIKLTTALYYTPSGTSIQAKGIQPDISVDQLQLAKNKESGNALETIDEEDLIGHLDNDKTAEATKQTEIEKKENAETTKKEQSLAQEDFQLFEALTLLKAMNAITK